MRPRSLAFATLVGCAAAPAPAARVVLGPACPKAPEPHVAMPPPHHDSACWKRGRPALAAKTKRDDNPFCTALDAGEVARVESRIQKDFHVTQKPSKLVIDFGCQETYGTVTSVVFEDGSGHGGSLRIVLLERLGQTVDVRSIASSHYYNPGVALGTAQIALRDYESFIEHARVAMVAKPHLVILSVPSQMFGGGSFRSSSNDFHRLLELVDEQGHVTERAFTGYDSDSSQGTIIPVRLATDPLQALVDALPLTKHAAPTDEDKRLFTRRFVEAMKHAEDRYFWWVKERFVEDAALLGTIDAVPGLVAVAQHKGEASADRTRAPALAAIAAITGWDPRVDERGHPRSEDEAAAAAARECAL